MLHKHLFNVLVKAQRIQLIHPIQMNARIDAELRSLKQLQQRQEDYLNQYDQLFRLVSIYILVNGYDLTNYQPHQVLKDVCIQHCSHVDVLSMVQQRHDLKKGLKQTSLKSNEHALQQCLGYFKVYLQAYV